MKSYRCKWASSHELFIPYHDTEWGVPVKDDRYLFEKLSLEGAQAGLSWLTVLKKRDAYKLLFDNFDVDIIARYEQQKIDELLSDPRIIRNKLKVNSVVSNAQAVIKLRSEFDNFSDYIWSFVGDNPITNEWRSLSEIPANTEISDRMSKDMKKRGFKFVGTTICYAFMQGIGMVNDHEMDCFRYAEIRSGNY
ncbi:MAG: DNA-3-methyladenine glycosylase I [Chitinophagales bacterium]|nr:DNA-3-methyladenine glycosylase I [Chitinophagales bacterium]